MESSDDSKFMFAFAEERFAIKYQRSWLAVSKPVKIIDSHLVSTFFDDYEKAYLHTTTELENRSSWTVECSLSVQVTTELEDGICLVELLQTQNLSIPAKSQVQYTFPKPNLWWPNGMGKQSLYNVVISIDVKEFGESDSWSHHFGFRKIESHIHDATSGSGSGSKDELKGLMRWAKFLPKMIMRVLLVEVDESSRQIIATLLRKCSYKVAVVPDGLKVWELLKGRPHNVDLILTKVDLPSISGYALLSLIMEHNICKNIQS